tara:strand:- start:158 stop:283 length:126 start_codon:yes stop_codon:yes gene_type:complete
MSHINLDKYKHIVLDDGEVVFLEKVYVNDVVYFREEVYPDA